MFSWNVYLVPCLAFSFAFLIGLYIKDSRYRTYLSKLGALPRQVPHRLPFGLDLLWETIKANDSNANYEFVDKYVKSTGCTFQMRVPGVRPIMTVDPENIKALLATQFNDFGKGQEFHASWEVFLGDGIFAVDGDTWSNARALIRPQFKKQRISDLEIFEHHFQKMLSLLPKDRRTLDLSDWWYKFTLDAATHFLFGQSVNSLDNPKTLFAEAFRAIQEIQFLIFRMGPLWRLYRPKRLFDSIKVLNSFIEPFVERAVSQTHKDFEEKERSGRIINFTDSLSQFTNDKKVLRDQLVNTLLAGRDTTAATLTWLFYELSYHPEIYKQLREEVLGTLGKDGRPTYENLKDMKFLQYCLNETLRLYPIVPFNFRSALKDTTLPRGGGPLGQDPIAIPKGTPVNYCPLYMQRRQDIFGPTVNDFAPSRWQTWIPEPWTYIPFNGGPRICLGQNFALTEMAYVTARMCQCFERIEERSGEERGSVGFKTDVILTPAKEVKIALIPVSKS